MKAGEVTWEPDFPSEVREALAPLLERWLPLVPTWCQEFIVRYDAQRDARMAATINYRNRWAVLHVTGQWLADSPEDRANSLRHELIHVALEPFAHPAGRIIEDVTAEGTPLRELCDSMFTDGMEAAVEDLARGIGRLLSGP